MFKVQTELLVTLDLSEKHKTNSCAVCILSIIVSLTNVSGGMCLGCIECYQIMTHVT